VEDDDICGFNCQFISSRAPKQEGKQSFLEIPDSKVGQMLDKAFVLVRIFQHSISCTNSIFKVRCSLALSPSQQVKKSIFVDDDSNLFCVPCAVEHCECSKLLLYGLSSFFDVCHIFS